MRDKKVIGLLGVLIAAIIILIGVYVCFVPKSTAGTKEITIEVVDNENKETSYTVETDAEYLREAMEEAEGLSFDGTEGEYGFTLITVNGLTADFEVENAYWAIYVNGEYGQYGIDAQPIEDGQEYRIVYEKM